MRRTLSLGMIGLCATSLLLLAQDNKKAKTNYAKLEVRGVLKVEGKMGEIPELDTVFAGRQWGLHFPNCLPAIPNTGVSVHVEDIGIIDVYFGDNKKLIELAEQLNGKTVVLRGDYRMITAIKALPINFEKSPMENQRITYAYEMKKTIVHVSTLAAIGD